MRIAVNLHGLIAVVGIVVAIVIGLFQQGRVPIWYLLIGILLYAGIVFLISNRREAQEADKRFILTAQTRLLYMRILIGAHLAFIFLIVGELLVVNFEFLLQVAYFVVAIAFAMIVPFVILTSSSTTEKR